MGIVCRQCVLFIRCILGVWLAAVCSVVEGPEGGTQPGAIPRGGNIGAPPPHKGEEEEELTLDDDG